MIGPMMTARGSVAGRLLALLLLMAGLWNPSLPWRDAPLDLLVLLDDSQSMDGTWLRQSWARLRDSTADLPDGSRISLIRFAGEADIELRQWSAARPLPTEIPRSRPLDGSRSDPAAALDAAATLVQPARSVRTLLLSDGLSTQGELDPSALFPAGNGTPLFWWRPESISRPSAWIRSLQVPERPGAGERVPVIAELGGDLQPDMRLELRIDDRPATESLPLSNIQLAFARLQLTAPPPGRYRLEAVLSRGNETLHRQRTFLRVAGPARVLLIERDSAGSGLAASLLRGGWPTQALPPGQVRRDMLETADAVILNDIAVHEFSTTFWQALARRVRQQGMGLLVLGGPGSFAAGGYRHSLLEELLPVTAEAPRPLPSAAVLFLVDSSGSMARRLHPEAPNRFAMARRAVLETAADLEPGDLSGLLTFDLEPRELVGLAHHRPPERTLRHAWQLRPDGGTRLAPALARGLDLLRDTDTQQRLLVLVTDGFLEQSAELERLAAEAAAAEIRIIALAIGAEARLDTLHVLARAGSGRVLEVAEVAQLPRLMQTEVARERNPVQPGPVFPYADPDFELLEPRPDHWPPIAAYVLARARPEARTMLTARNGDPLLAEWIAGSGRVVALPVGLGPWAEAWRKWARWGELLGGLVEWTAALHGDDLFLRELPAQKGLALQLEAVNESGEWAGGETLQVQASGPLGRELPVSVAEQAPGRFLVRIAARLEGRHHIGLRLGDRLRNHAVYFRPSLELDPEARPDQTLLRGLSQGRVQAWSPGLGLAPEPGRLPARQLFTCLALLAFLITLGAERELLTRPAPGSVRARLPLKLHWRRA